MSKRKRYLFEILLKTSGQYDCYKEILSSYLLALSAKHAGIPEDKLLLIIKKFDIEFLCESIFSIYDKVFSVEEIEKLIDFYNGEIGKKLVSKSFVQQFSGTLKNVIYQIEKEMIIYEKEMQV